jgi:filamentous hemagglutinin family protein
MRHRLLSGTSLRTLQASLVWAGVSAAAPAWGLPQGGVVSGGAAQITGQGPVVQINQQTDRAVIDWQAFNIAPGEEARFSQPSVSSAILNRIHDQNPSQIMGSLSANGIVALVNPNGMVFGRGVQIDVGSLIATTADIPNERFLTGQSLLFGQPGGMDAEVVNQGHITVQEGGLAALVAPRVINTGVIEAKAGRVALGAGEVFTVDLYGDGLVSLAASDRLDAVAVEQDGGISAQGGTVLLTTAEAKRVMDQTINMDGWVDVSGLTREAGNIVLHAAQGTANVSGKLHADGAVGTGGRLQVTGEHVKVGSGAILTALGTYGGGDIKIGGDYLGGGTTPRAKTTRIDPAASINAGATYDGKGGRVIVWSDERTDFGGMIYARGGLLGGDGGFVETSSKNILIAHGLVDASAPQGKGGEWLLDPNNIAITSGASTNVAGAPDYVTTNDTAVVDRDDIQTALNAGTSVTITTGTAGGNSQTGNITVSNSITKSAGGDASLTLKAHGNIDVNAGISSSSGALDLTLWSDSDSAGGGYIRVTGAAITTNGGDVIMGGGADPAANPAIGNATVDDGVTLNNGDISTGAGNISIRGRGENAGSSNMGISMIGGSVIQTTTGNITITGVGGAGGANNYGIHIFDSTLTQAVSINTVAGDITLTGTGGAGTTANNIGVVLQGTPVVSSTGMGAGAGNIVIDGTGGTGNTNANGVSLWMASLLTVDGDITVDGTGGSGGASNEGIDQGSNQVFITSSGTGADAGNITLIGVGGTGTSDNAGVYWIGDLSTVDGDITITGIGGNGSTSSNQGIFIDNGGIIESTGTGASAGNITLDGTGGNGTSSNHGIFFDVADITTVDGDIDITGTGGNGTGSFNTGLNLLDLDVASTGTGAGAGTITLTGAGRGVSTGIGIYGDNGSSILSVDGDIALVGSSTATGDDNSGIQFSWPGGGAGAVTIASSGVGADAASITFTGSGSDNGTNDNYGLALLDSVVTINTVDGDVTLTGTAGDGAGVNNYGIQLATGADVISTGTGASAGDITLDGTGGNGTSANYGVYLTAAGTEITTVDGDILITGEAGTGTSVNHGVYLTGGGSIASTGTGAEAGNITLDGTAHGSGSWNTGVALQAFGVATSITSVDGDISLTGIGAGGAGGIENWGVSVNESTVSTSGAGAGAGNITLTGTGGTGTGGINHGVYVFNTGLVTTAGPGTISLTGTAGATSGSDIASDTGANVIGGAGADGDITLTGNTMSLANLSVQTTEDIIIKPRTAGGTIGVSGGAGDLQITDTVLGFMNVGDTLIIGNSTAGTGLVDVSAWDISGETFNLEVYGGTVDFTGAFTYNGANNLTFVSRTGDLAVDQAINKTAGGAASLTLAAANNLTVTQNITPAAGALDVTLWGDWGNSGAGAISVTNAAITTLGGDVIMGGGADPTLDEAVGTADFGVDLNNGDISTGAGNISIRGREENAGGSNVGVLIRNASVLQTTTGDIDITGIGGNGTSDNYGVYYTAAGTAITTVDGDIFITGIGGNGSGNWNFGIGGDVGANISSTGTGASAGNITLDGTGGDGTSNNFGIFLDSSGGAGATITTVDGNIEITGTGGDGSSADNYGVSVSDGTRIESAGTGASAGNITLTGFGGDGTANNYGVYLSAAGTEITSVDGDILLDGTGGDGSANSNMGVALDVGAEITSTGAGAGAGNITLIGVGGDGTVANRGVDLGGATVSTVDGDIFFDGTGGSDGTGDFNGGIVINGGSLVESTGDGLITFDGTGGDGTGDNYGVLLETAGTAISTVDGDISMTGTGGDGSATDNYGIYVLNDALIESTGAAKADAGTITLIGAASGTGWGRGIVLSDGDITSVAGNISLTGTSTGTGGNNDGINFGNDGAVSSTGTGANAADITLNGTASDNGTSWNIGIVMDTGFVTTVDGDIDMTGAGGDGSSSENFGFYMASASTIDSTGTGAVAGTITLDGTGGNGTTNNIGVWLDGAGTSVTSVDGAIDITGTGGSDGTDGTNYGIQLSAAADITSTGIGANAATITLDGTGGDGTGANYGVYLRNGGTLTAVDGDIEITGTGGAGSANLNYGIFVLSGGGITSTGTGADAANITLDGTGGTGASSEHYGVYLQSAGTLISTVDGDIDITGLGGTGVGGDNTGIWLWSQPRIISTGTGAGAGTITLNGTGGTGSSFNVGIALGSAGTEITAVDGAISLTGVGGDGTAAQNHGILINDSADITSTGTGAEAATITLSGTGGDGTNDNHGIWLDDAGTAIAATDGDIAITGIGAAGASGTNNDGIRLENDADVLSTGAAAIALTGTAGANANSEDIQTLTGAIAIGSGTAAGNITLTANTVDLADLAVTTTQDIFVTPRTAVTTVGVGGGAGILNLTDVELAFFNAGSELIIGRADGTGAMTVDAYNAWNSPVIFRVDPTGAITVAGAQTATAASDAALTFSGPVALNAAIDVTAATGGTQAITFNDTLDLGADITSDGDMNFGGDVTLSADVVLDAGTGDFVFDGTVEGTQDLEITTTADITFNDDVGGTTRLGDVTVDPRHFTAGAFNAASFTLTNGTGIVNFTGAGLNTTGDIGIETNDDILGTYAGTNGTLDAGAGDLAATVSFSGLDISGAAATLLAGYIGTPGAATQAMANLISIDGVSHPGLPGSPAYTFAGFIIGTFPPGSVGGGGSSDDSGVSPVPVSPLEPAHPAPPAEPQTPSSPVTVTPQPTGAFSLSDPARPARTAQEMAGMRMKTKTRPEPRSHASSRLITYSRALYRLLGCSPSDKNCYEEETP